MSFISWQYALLLAGVSAFYWRLPWRGRIWLLLGASYFFYGVWDVRFLALLLASTAIDFFCGLAVTRERRPTAQVLLSACLPAAWLGIYSFCFPAGARVDGWILGTAAAFPVVFTLLYLALWRMPAERQKRAFLLLSIVSNLGVLVFFKYFNFFGDAAVTLLAQLGWQADWTLPHIVLPVAISFYTFQSIAYSVDIYRGKARPARDFVTFAAYLSFFPQFVAGPIERPNDLLPQFEKAAAWNMEHLHHGLRLLLVGLFKKVFIADNCALLANHAFAADTPLNAPWAVLGVVAFAFQIYGDFSGYTDLARGSARLLGIHLSDNFHFPYFAKGPSEFWRRWHITLSSWFRDYVYIPLGGNRAGPARTLCNLWLTMLLAGLWHGASWTFVLWGAFHGALLILYRVTPALGKLEQSQGALGTALATGLMFVFTLFGWALFRCHDLAELTHWFAALGHWQVAGAVGWAQPFCWLLLHVLPLILLQAVTWRRRDEAKLPHLPWVARGTAYALMIAAVATSAGADVEFIYFQF